MKIMELEKETLYELMKRIILVTNLWAFEMEKELKKTEHDEKRLSEFFLRVNEEFGRKQAEGLKKMGLITAAGISGVEQALLYSHWAVLEDLRVKKLDDKNLLFGVVGCSTIKAMTKWDQEINCHETGWKVREAFLRVIEPSARVSPCFKGIEENKAYSGFSCLWEVTVY